MKFMSWSLNAPVDYYFDNYIQKQNGEWVVVDEKAINDWGDSSRNFFHMYEKYPHKIHTFGLHEFGVNPDGTIYDFLTEDTSSGERMGEPVLSDDGSSIERWCKHSLQYLMENHPHVRYAIQLINFQSTGQSKVDDFLDDTAKWDICIQETKTIAELYLAEGYPITDIEIDFERASSRDGDHELYRDFLIQVKNDVCLQLGLGLRVNMYAMTDDMTPSYYRWHDYKTLADAEDRNGDQAIDEFQLMTYDFTYAYSAPGPSTPLWWLEEVLNHVQNSLPPEKTWIGNAGYGRRWGLDGEQAGSAVTFKQITMWQNGMYVHNHGDDENDTWVWHNQSWLPFIAFNDVASGYQITYPHLYDKFSIHHSEQTHGTVNHTTFSDEDIITSYFKSQQPIFTGVQGIANEAQPSGRFEVVYAGGRTIPAKYLGQDTTFGGAYRPNKALYIYDENQEACVPSPDEDGEEGQVIFDFNVDTTGNHKLIALVHFNTLENNEVIGDINGQSFSVGGSNLPDWFPFYVDTYAWVEVGNFDFQTSNSITIDRESTGYIWGFVVCDDFDQNFLGGEVAFDSYIMPYQKRGEQQEDGTVKQEQAIFPSDLTVTGEILRNPPRPAVIFEDTFNSLLNNQEAGYNIANIPYYQNITDSWNTGETSREYEGEYICTDSEGVQTIGFSDGTWELQEDGSIEVETGGNWSNQLVLYKPFSANIQVQADIAITGLYPKAGIRLLQTQEGTGNEGYLALLDYETNEVKLVYEDGPQNYSEIASEWMSDGLIDLKGNSVTLYATIHNGMAYVRVNDREYLSEISLDNASTSGVFGVHVVNGGLNLTRFNVSTVDRWEPLEKMQVTIDGQTYDYGEVDRGLSYDDYGYLIYSGLDIEGLDDDNQDSGEVGGSPDFSEDFQNKPLATHPSWQGAKSIYVRMKDAGIWFTNLYIGDSEGFSVAYNSDVIGFVDTAKLLFDYQCKGVAMWTMGQEDPLIFEYLPND